jgi:ABC-2 type transport system permease protein
MGSSTRLVRVELLKLRTTRLTFGLFAAAVGLSVLFSILEASRAGTKSVAPLSTAAGLNSVITGGVLALLFAAVLGVTISSGEFRHQTATTTYLATPKRSRVLVAKSAAAACGGAVFGFAGWLIATGVGLGFVTSDGDRVVIGDATMARYAAGHVLAGALLAVIGVGIGSLIRSQLAGIIGVLVWAVVIESIIGGLFNSVQPYLPYTAATTLAGSVLGGAAFGPAHGAASSASPLPFAAATALLAAVAVVISAIAARTTVVRDIS